ncbi:helix-turn-helix transcriptional regulator [Actinacidiphila sp. DG2A-62]|jgi:transcriptional regulator with XRE-family HTH domain|uniref:helix-turn-helix transcriptional regulator n=1 Tax=Actinacidiphila sp. DG2A-62 TaxID=3108821 RepID=UPI002DBDC992|nr:helix-turn-helix transcriptional regulator [Actinacidiphila sp. DG2A-62]MEC3998129.1 helix-turn-helix transcriptional regulator [Actinacidiphila sp. DG2A-62]
MAQKDAAGLGATIRAWRERLSPAAAGLPSGPGRRAAGLRREELAERAGLSVDYVVRLEQGRATAPSAQVVGALAHALHLSGAEREHLHRMAGLAPPDAGPVPDRLPPGVRRVLDRLGDVAVAVFAADWQMIWWNPGWAALLGDPAAVPPRLRNFARERFPVGPEPVRISRWPVATDDAEQSDLAVVSDLRRATGRFPHDARLAALVRELTAGNAGFARLWASGTVAAHREDRKVVRHPDVGSVEVDCDVLTDGDSELKIVILTPSPGTADAARFHRALAQCEAGTAASAPHLAPDAPGTPADASSATDAVSSR